MNFNEILQDSGAYIESVGKHDRQNVVDAFEIDGNNSVLRICMGATDSMPLRALSLVTSGLAVIEQLAPEAQLQIVHPLSAVAKVSGEGSLEGLKQANKLRDITMGMVSAHCPMFQNRITFLSDNEVDLGFLDETVEIKQALDSAPSINERLHTKAIRNSGDVAQYLVAHLLMQDSRTNLTPLSSEDPQPQDFETLISLGAQSERIYYSARMLCRKLDIFVPEHVDKTGQLFSSHVLPPHLPCKQGEPHVSQFRHIRGGAEHPVRSVQRDLEYLRGFVTRQIMEGHRWPA